MNAKPARSSSQQALNITDALGLGPRDASVLAGISESNLRRLIKAGTIKAVRIGRRVIVPRSEIERLLRPCAAPRSASIHHGPRPVA